MFCFYLPWVNLHEWIPLNLVFHLLDGILARPNQRKLETSIWDDNEFQRLPHYPLKLKVIDRQKFSLDYTRLWCTNGEISKLDHAVIWYHFLPKLLKYWNILQKCSLKFVTRYRANLAINEPRNKLQNRFTWVVEMRTGTMKNHCVGW